MHRHTVRFITLGLTLLAGTGLAAPTVTLNGKTVNVPTVEHGGRVFVDAEALAKLLGSAATFDKASKRLALTLATPGVQGTAQQAGDLGAFGQTFTIGKNSDALNFTLLGAEYTVDRVNIGSVTYVPKADEKFLVLRYTVQNPQSRERRYYWSDLRFSAVDAQDVTRNFEQAVAREGTSEALNVQIKPAQKVSVYTLIRLPARGPAPKLIVSSTDPKVPVVRYDLRGKVKPLPEGYRDASDADGTTAVTRADALMGRKYQLGTFDVSVEGVTYATGEIEKKAPGAGKRYAVVNLKVSNGAPRTTRLYWSDLKFDLLDSRGDRLKWNQALLHATDDNRTTWHLEPGEEVRTRVYFEVPSDADVKSLTITQDTARPHVFDLSAAR